MKKTLFVLLMSMVVVALAHAATPTTPVVTEDAAETQVSEQPRATFDLLAWSEQQTVAPMCTYDSAEEVPFFVESRSGGQNCGGVTCGLFQYCCNPSCGICVYYGMSCTQQSCI